MEVLYVRFSIFILLAVNFCSVYAETSVETAGRIRSANTDEGSNSSDALTLKARISVNHRVSDETSIFFQLDHVESFLDDQHSTVLLVNDNPRFQDTPGTDLNQLFLAVEPDNYLIKLGRQKITLASERFIGDVDFWQNDQTFDAVKIKAQLFSASTVQYIYAGNVNRIFGDDADGTLDRQDIRFEALKGRRPVTEQGDHKIDGNFLHLELNEWDYVNYVAYYYALHNSDLPAASNRTVGFSGHFRYKPSSIKYFATLEYALQKQQQSRISAWVPYQLLELGIGWKLPSTTSQQLGLNARWEILNDKKGNAFITPLASLHDFQGWADQFTTTPAGGVDDRSVRINWKMRPFQIDFRYHHFSSAEENFDFGQEFNVDFIVKPSRKHEFKIRYADFAPEREQMVLTDNIKSLFISYSFNL